MHQLWLDCCNTNRHLWNRSFAFIKEALFLSNNVTFLICAKFVEMDAPRHMGHAVLLSYCPVWQYTVTEKYLANRIQKEDFCQLAGFTDRVHCKRLKSRFQQNKIKKATSTLHVVFTTWKWFQV